MAKDHCLRIAPSRVEGLVGVSEVLIWPDRLELVSESNRTIVGFCEIARWPRPSWLWRALYRVGIRPRWLPVADRDWFHPPRDRFFRFYTRPPIVVFMPDDELGGPYGETYFFRFQEMMRAGGYHTNDLG
jgi:hypothetical protein